MKTLRLGLVAAVFLSCHYALAGNAAACKASLDQCPLQGCAKDAPSALVNVTKHGHAMSGTPVSLTFADFLSLQQQLDKMFNGNYATLAKPDRMRLKNLQIGGQKVGEGDFVEVTGFIAVQPSGSHPHANTGESVNCNLHGPPNNDFHINLTPKSGDTEFHGIVVEMIPQNRDANWTEARLALVQQAGLMVRARGQLMLDNHHFVNGDPNNNKGSQPKRFALWEVHPIVEFDVCTAGSSCTATSSSWQPLENWNQSGSGSSSGGKKKHP
ncbi:MAG TPA: hypothetical protein VEW69_03935 [Alphaproteobacteria bacterium]|nr:hypothetical protein [Alphaproteobacteria bacterium]